MNMPVYMAAKRPPNLMYIFSRKETALLLNSFAPESWLSRQRILIKLMGHGFDEPAYTERTKYLLNLWKKFRCIDKIIMEAGFPTTLTEPHHILEDGTRIDQPGRDGPFRTYFDGSSIDKLGHAVAICIDKKAGTITTQCSRGKDFAASGEEILHDIFPEYERITLRACQQTDAHSCTAYAMYNVLAMAGVMPSRESLDILAWRGRLLETLDACGFEGDISPSWLKESWFFAAGPREAIQRWHNPPIYVQRYARPMEAAPAF